MKGFPITFRCGKCRSTLNRETDTGRRSRVVLTGKTKQHYRSGRYFNRHADGTSRQYKCLDCGHVGWSSHNDLIGVKLNTGNEPRRRRWL